MLKLTKRNYNFFAFFFFLLTLRSDVATPKNSIKTIKKNENNEKGKSRTFCSRRNGYCASHLCVGVDMVNLNHSGSMTKKIPQDASILVQVITKWVLIYLKRERRLPTTQTIYYEFTHYYGYTESPQLEQLIKHAIDNVMSMPYYKQLKNKQKQSKQ